MNVFVHHVLTGFAWQLPIEAVSQMHEEGIVTTMSKEDTESTDFYVLPATQLAIYAGAPDSKVREADKTLFPAPDPMMIPSWPDEFAFMRLKAWGNWREHDLFGDAYSVIHLHRNPLAEEAPLLPTDFYLPRNMIEELQQHAAKPPKVFSDMLMQCVELQLRQEHGDGVLCSLGNLCWIIPHEHFDVVKMRALMLTYYCDRLG